MIALPLPTSIYFPRVDSEDKRRHQIYSQPHCFLYIMVRWKRSISVSRKTIWYRMDGKKRDHKRTICDCCTSVVLSATADFSLVISSPKTQPLDPYPPHDGTKIHERWKHWIQIFSSISNVSDKFSSFIPQNKMGTKNPLSSPTYSHFLGRMGMVGDGEKWPAKSFLWWLKSPS